MSALLIRNRESHSEIRAFIASREAVGLAEQLFKTCARIGEADASTLGGCSNGTERGAAVDDRQSQFGVVALTLQPNPTGIAVGFDAVFHGVFNQRLQ